MTLKITETGSGRCKYVLNDKAPFFCCGEPVREPLTDGVPCPYCPAHAKLCLNGTGRDWRALAEMIYGVEQTITRTA